MINKVDLGGTKYPFRFSFNALIKLEELLGEDPFDLLANEAKARSPLVIRALVYSGIYGGSVLAKKELKLSLEEVGDLLEMSEIGTYLGLFTSDIESSVKKNK